MLRGFTLSIRFFYANKFFTAKNILVKISAKIEEIATYLVSSLSVLAPVGFLQEPKLVVLLLSLAALKVHQGYVYKYMYKTYFMTVMYGETTDFNIDTHIRTNFGR